MNAGPSRHLPSLTGLRWAAALAVFGYHAVILLAGSAEQALRAVAGHGRVGVSFFFILSGFIVTWAWREGDSAPSFWRRRFARIYPAYAVALVIAVALSPVTHQDMSVFGIASNVGLLQAWVPERSVFFSGNDVGWSLSCEAFFYAAFPFALLALRRLTSRQRRLVQFAAAAAIVVVGVCAAVSMPDDYFGAGGPAVFVSYIFPPVRLLEFIIGITLALDLRDGLRPPLGWRPALGLAVAALVVNRVVPQGLDFAAVTVVPFSLLILAAAQSDIDGRATVMSNRYVVLLGEWSFCFYLVHRLVLLVVSQVHGPVGGPLGLALVLASLVAGILASWALHSWVEKPMYRRLKGGSRVELPISMRDEKAPL